MRVHVIGAGIAGMAAAMSLRAHGIPVTVWEATDHAGGRARSLADGRLGVEIDNGAHLMLAANSAVLRLADRLGSREALVMARQARFPLFDRRTGRRFLFTAPARGLPRFEPAGGKFVPSGQERAPVPVPKLSMGELLRVLALPFMARATVAEALGGSSLWDIFWEPLALGVLNTDPREAMLQPLLAVLRETLLRGGRAMRPVLAAGGLSAVFARPFLKRAVEDAGLVLKLNTPVRALRAQGARVTAFIAGRGARQEEVEIGEEDSVILAVPPWEAVRLWPALMTPDDFRPIVNVHYRLPRPPSPPFPEIAPGVFFCGVIGGLAQWIFGRGEVVSVTISDARALNERNNEEIALACWSDVRAALGLSGQIGERNEAIQDIGPADGDAGSSETIAGIPPWRVIRERRATFACTPGQLQRRADARTGLFNLLLAGDWTRTGLPATLEGAARSGEHAAALVLENHRG
jgi:squalene-associated FAD-dependent desaturase